MMKLRDEYQQHLESYVKTDRAARDMDDPAMRQIADKKLSEHWEALQRIRAQMISEAYRVRVGLGP